VRKSEFVLAMIASMACAGMVKGQKPPLLAEKDVAALANELSGETAKRNLEVIATFHRQRGSQGFHAVAELVAERARAYGLSDVQILEFPADGKIFYGTQRSRPAWDAEKGDLELYAPLSPQPCGKMDRSKVIANCIGGPTILHASYESEPVALAEDSESADVITTLADVGAGTKESDYEGQDIRGRVVLVSAQPGAVQDLAVGKFGAVGIISYAQNQKTAWSGENRDAIRWGHLETFSANKTFAFMVSLKTAQELRERVKETGVLVRAVVKAGQHAGNYEVVTAVIPGADARLKEEEIAFSCHLDHQRPGANDNASGCVTILEVARTLEKLIAEGKLVRPSRTIRFIWPPEIEGTITLLNAKPELTKRIKAAIHMDMVGGGPETKAVFHATRGPMSLPSFVHDVAWAFAEFVNEESYKFAATGNADYPLVAPEGGHEPLRAEYSAYTMGSDHDVYQDSSFGIPAIYMNDWPDRYIHTNFDMAANIDPTKLKRAAFIGAASGYFLAGLDQKNGAKIVLSSEFRAARLLLEAGRRSDELDRPEQNILKQVFNQYAKDAEGSVNGFLTGGMAKGAGAQQSTNTQGRVSGPIYARAAQPRGPLAVFGYDYFADHAKAAGVAEPKLFSYEGLWGSGQEYAYEVLNFADGKRNAQEIRDAVSAEYGPVPLDLVVEYLRALQKIGLVAEVK
jgi:aminopeptidase YwaD